MNRTGNRRTDGFGTGTGGTGQGTGTGGTGTGKNENVGQPTKIKTNLKIHPKSKNSMPQPSLFGGVGRCYSLILDGGGMLFFDFGWIFGGFLIFGGWPKFSFFLSKLEPAEPEPAAVGTDPNRTEPWVSCSSQIVHAR